MADDPSGRLNCMMISSAFLASALAFNVPHAQVLPRLARACPITASAAWATSSTGLKTLDESIGEGDEAKKGSVVKFKYTSRVAGPDGAELDSQPAVQFEIGKVDIIPGWEEGLTGMKAGGKRKLNIPPELWSGAKIATDLKVDPKAVLEFDFELLEVKTPTLIERFGQQNVILASLIALIGFYEGACYTGF